jgi:hypothetical protein
VYTRSHVIVSMVSASECIMRRVNIVRSKKLSSFACANTTMSQLSHAEESGRAHNVRALNNYEFIFTKNDCDDDVMATRDPIENRMCRFDVLMTNICSTNGADTHTAQSPQPKSMAKFIAPDSSSFIHPSSLLYESTIYYMTMITLLSSRWHAIF